MKQVILIDSVVDGSQCVVVNGVVVLENENDSYGYPLDEDAAALAKALNVGLHSLTWYEKRPADWEDVYKELLLEVPFIENVIADSTVKDKPYVVLLQTDTDKYEVKVGNAAITFNALAPALIEFAESVKSYQK